MTFTAIEPLVIELSPETESKFSLVGGKGFNLHKVVKAGLPVPEAFCVTTEAYSAFVDGNDLDGVIKRELDGADFSDVVGLAARATRIRDAFLAGRIPDAVAEAIATAYAHLDAQRDGVSASVRSSATAEDLPGASFAGQQDTYLCISGLDHILDHVRRCWGSLWTDRAIAYRQHEGFSQDEVRLAVVVQRMFPSQVAGIMFTANPVTHNPTQMFINASWGLGDAIVSGRVNPDQFILDKRSSALVSKEICEKKTMTVRNADGPGSHDAEVPADLQLAETLSQAELEELAEIGRRVEAHYGFPQDIEWGFADGQFAILQSRDVTAADLDVSEGLELYQTPEALEAMHDERWLWSRGWSDEVQTGPSSPWWYSYQNHNMTLMRREMLELTDTQEFLGYGADEFHKIPIFRWYGARAYVNTAVERERIRRFIPPFARDDSATWLFPANEREPVQAMAFNWPSFLKTLWDIHIHRPHVSLLTSQQVMLENLPAWKEQEEARWAEVDMETASAREMTSLQFNLRIDTGFATNVTLPFSVYLFFLPAAFKLLCRDWFDDPDDKVYAALITGLNSKTSEENVAIWRLAQSIKTMPALVEILNEDEPLALVLAKLQAAPEAIEFNSLFAEFIATYGHRGGSERDPYSRRYRHAPQNVLVPVRAMVGLDDESGPEVMEHENARRMREVRETCLKTLRAAELGFVRAPFFAWFVELVQQWMYCRDFERFYNDKTMSRPRDWLTALGRRYVARGLMTDPEDVFFLSKEEVIMVDEGDLDANAIEVRVSSRRRVYDRYSQREPPKYIRGWHFFDDEELADDGKGLRGIPASNGVVTGRARVCRTLDDIGSVRADEILITVATDPGWTTVFSFIGGVVVETGGVISHAVMISREHGLPCVANLPDACTRIPDGAMITVDGTNGRVIVHDEAALASAQQARTEELPRR